MMILKYSCLLLVKGELCWLHGNYILILNFHFELSNFGHLYLLCDLFQILNSTLIGLQLMKEARQLFYLTLKHYSVTNLGIY